jgi:uncharacterized protein YdhG (YjbR/CyaY superfamily)
MASPIDEFLAGVEPAKRAALQRIRELAEAFVPDAEETIAYRMPTLKYAGKPFLGFDAHAKHVGIYPYSAGVIAELGERLAGYACSKGAIRVPYDRPIPKTLLREIVACRLKAIRAETKKPR